MINSTNNIGSLIYQNIFWLPELINPQLNALRQKIAGTKGNPHTWFLYHCGLWRLSPAGIELKIIMLLPKSADDIQ
ncbi:hypothetical protein ACB092_01G066500 [Castanea dentata]